MRGIFCCARAASGNVATPSINEMNSRRLIASPEARTSHSTDLNQHIGKGAQCPLWVISGHSAVQSPCPLYPRKRTFAVQLEMSAMGQKRTHAPQQTASLFDQAFSSPNGTMRPSPFDDLIDMRASSAARHGEVEDLLRLSPAHTSVTVLGV
jgi:hypothetical protein